MLLILAGIVRLGAAAYWDQHWHGRFVFGDSRGYFELGQVIARGQPYQLSTGEQVFRAPGYPLLLAPMIRLFDGPSVVWAARIESCLFGVLTVLAVAWWAGIVFGPRAAWIAGLITALYPEAVVISVPVLSEGPFCLLVAVNLALWTAAWKSAVGWDQRAPASAGPPEGGLSPRWWACARLGSLVPSYLLTLLTGVTAAAATLIRPSWLLFLPFAAACSMFRSPCHHGPRYAAIMLAGFIAVMLPWWARNYRITGHFVPTTLQVGASLYDGLNPQANGASDMRFVPEFEAAQRKSDAENAVSGDFEYRLDRRLRQAAWNWACSNPLRVMQLAGIKLLRIWNFWPNEPTFSAWPVRLVVLVTYVPLMFVAGLGAWRFNRRGWPIVLCWLPAVYFSLLHMVFVSSIRYRQPALLGLIVLAAGCLADFAPQSRKTAACPSA